MRFFMSPKSAIAAVAAVVSLGCAAPAAAAVVLYTYTGTVSEGYDATGVFGTAGRDLTGLAFTAKYWRDDAAPGAYSYENAGYTIIDGPIIASLTVADTGPITFGQAYGTNQEQFSTEYAEGFYESFFHRLQAYTETDNVEANERLVEFGALHMGAYGSAHYLPNNDYRTLPSLTAAATPGFTWAGYFSIDRSLYDLNTGDVLSYDNVYAYFAPTRLTVTVVPEPAAWALMLTGFFGAGAAIRSRRRAPLAGTRQPA